MFKCLVFKQKASKQIDIVWFAYIICTVHLRRTKLQKVANIFYGIR